MTFEDGRHYRPRDLSELASVSTLAQWRHYGRGPAYIRFGSRIFYAGHDLNSWLRRHRVDPEKETPTGK